MDIKSNPNPKGTLNCSNVYKLEKTLTHLFHEPEFKKIAGTLEGYSLDLYGKIIFPQQIDEENKR